MRSWFNKLLSIGTANIADHRLINQVGFANILGLTIVVFGIMFFAFNSFLRSDYILAISTLILVPVGLLVVLLNHFGYHKAARIVVAFFPLTVCVFLPPLVFWLKDFAIDLPPGEQLLELAHSKMGAIAVSVCPFVLLDMRRRANLLFVPIATFGLILLIDPLTLAIHPLTYSDAGVTGTMIQYSNFITLAVVTVVLLCMFFISSLNIRYEDRMLATIAELNQKSTKLKAEIDLRLQSEMEMQRAKDEALDAVRSRTAFFSHINHEIRTPLHGIMGLTSFLDEPASEEEKQKLHTSLKISAAELMRLVNNVLDLNKIESEKFDLHERAFNLIAFFEKVSANYAGRSLVSGSVCQVEVVPNANLSLVSDDLRLSQVLHNLILNAIKHGKASRVNIGYERVSGAGLPDSITFFVADNGVGIGSAQQSNAENHIASEHSNHANQGFGLLISQKILQQMGSELQSSKGISGGTVFKFTIPLESRN